MDETQSILDEITFDEPEFAYDECIEIDPLRRRIYTEKSDPRISALYDDYKKGKLILQPDFQRYFVWDKSKASKLIESAILGIPLPIIYLSEEDGDREYVIDGQQRLTSFFSFIDGEFPKSRDEKVEFKLSGLKVITEINGKTFKELDDNLQDKISSYSVRTITFDRESNADLKFEIFERLNTGSVQLNDQELRNCMYRGPYNELIRKLSQYPDFKYLLNIKSAERRMNDIELVLRFAAFYHSSYLHFKPPIKKFLNEDMEKFQFINEKDASELINAFKNSVRSIRSLFGKRAFRRFKKGDKNNPNGKWESRQFNKSLYEILMYTFANIDYNQVQQNLDSIREALLDLMTNDQDFIDSIEKSTNTLKAVKTRFDKWRMTLDNIVDVEIKEPRCFSYKLKKEFYEKDPTCNICNQHIIEIDDAALDHIKQYWQGGRTIPENARLTHRYCNWSRSRKE